MDTFISQAPALTKTALKLAKLKGALDEEKILRSAKPRLVETGYDSWNNGTTQYSLILEIPLKLFSKIEPAREEFEKNIRERMASLTRRDSGNSISEVVITPVLLDEIPKPKGASVPEEKEATTEEGAPSFWRPGYFRLFISHSSVIKESAHNLKEALAKYKIASFVAHDDIEPSLEWQQEIESALRTMDALVAIISPEFQSSLWCDQEVGFALGRGKLVLPIIKGLTPYGFLGKLQGMQSKGLDAEKVAEKIIDILIQNPASSPRMTEVLVEKLVNSPSWASSKATISLLEKAPRISTSQAGRLLKAVDENVDVGKAIGVPGRINKLIERSSS